MTVLVAAAGVALRPRRGFAVGALAAIASNFFLGQGPHTPWQMLAWGGCGLLASLLRPLLRRRHWRSRRSCSCSGFAFGTLMDLWLWVAFYPHTEAALLARLAAGFRSNVALAAGNVVLALAVGPARVAGACSSALRAPLPDGGRVGVKLLAALLAGARWRRPPATTSRHSSARTEASATRRSRPGRRWGWWRPAPSLAKQPRTSRVRSRPTRPTRQLVAMARAAAGDRPDDLLPRLRAYRHGKLVNATIWTILALRQAGDPCAGARDRPARRRSLERRLAVAGRRGGGRERHGRGDPGAPRRGGGGRPIDRGVAFLRRHQNADGGFRLTLDRGSDTQSTAWAIQGLLPAAAPEQRPSATWRGCAGRTAATATTPAT